MRTMRVQTNEILADFYIKHAHTSYIINMTKKVLENDDVLCSSNIGPLPVGSNIFFTRDI